MKTKRYQYNARARWLAAYSLVRQYIRNDGSIPVEILDVRSFLPIVQAASIFTSTH